MDLDDPFGADSLPEDVIKKLEASGVLQSSRSKPPPPPKPKKKPPPPPPAPKAQSLNNMQGSQPMRQKTPTPNSSVIDESTSNYTLQPMRQKTPTPNSAPRPVQQTPQPQGPPPKKVELKGKIKPLYPNLQKLLKLISGGSILPGASYDKVKLDNDGKLFIGTMDIGQVLEGKDGDGFSIRIYFSKLQIQGDIPEIIRARFPIADAILMIHKAAKKFFIVTEKDVSLGLAKTDDDKPLMLVYGNL